MKDTWAVETAWEESLAALAEELWFWAVSREGLAARGVAVSHRQIARARLLARDVLIISGLPDAVDSERTSGLLEAAHELLNGSSGVRAVTALPAVLGSPPPPLRAVDTGEDLDEDEETLPRRMNPLLLSNLADDELEPTDVTRPGVPIEVFRAYLATR